MLKNEDGSRLVLSRETFIERMQSVTEIRIANALRAAKHPDVSEEDVAQWPAHLATEIVNTDLVREMGYAGLS